ncbi:unnamed protein product [Ixodes pacificus]
MGLTVYRSVAIDRARRCHPPGPPSSVPQGQSARGLSLRIITLTPRVQGTHNTVNRVFHAVSLECRHVGEGAMPELEEGLVVPRENVATVSRCAYVVEGVSRSRNALINGETGKYDWDSGYTCHQLGNGAIVVQLAQPYCVDSMRLLLWDCDSRQYSYYVEVSVDQQNWTMVADRRQELCRSWQLLRFPRQPVVFVRIVGTHNTANEVFHCVHFECPAQSLETGGAPKGRPEQRSPPNQGSSQSSSSQTPCKADS